MTIHRWGAGQVEREKLPLLSEWLEDHPVEAGTKFQVLKVSKSQQYGSFTLQCGLKGEKGFRVNIYDNSPVHELLVEKFAEWRKNGTAIFLEIVDEDWGHWEVVTTEEPGCQWQKSGSAFTCSVVTLE